MIPNLVDFKKMLLNEDLDKILETVLLSQEAKHVNSTKLDIIKKVISDAYAIPIPQIDLIVVGSAKLGFSIVEKEGYPRYRLFGFSSDIDIAIVCKPLFEKIWLELATYSARQINYPWFANRLGDYLVCGWLRPDHFPVRSSLYYCDLWMPLFNNFSRNKDLGRKKIRGGLYYSIEHLKVYQSIALRDCINFEKSKP